MSNILIIKHGSLGDIVQASGAIQDILKNHLNDNIYILTSKHYEDLFKKHGSIKDIIVDKRLSRFNVFYLYFLMKKIKSLNISKVYDLQNSSRTAFYKKILFPNAKKDIWSSSITTLPEGKTKTQFDKLPVLDRFDHQLKSCGIKTNYTLKPNIDWACENIEKIIQDYELKKFILIFPFCSPHLKKKRWPYYNDLIEIILNSMGNKYKIVVAPGPKEIKQANNYNVNCVLDNNQPLNINQLASLIKASSFVVSNDTGPAHMAAHLGAKGLALFGSHTTAHKVSIERELFKSIQVNDLNNLSPEKVFERMKKNLD